jgi:hypothetical protein
LKVIEKHFVVALALLGQKTKLARATHGGPFLGPRRKRTFLVEKIVCLSKQNPEL